MDRETFSKISIKEIRKGRLYSSNVHEFNEP